jgi:sporulation protein YlmC with PRC-barrel domain
MELRMLIAASLLATSLSGASALAVDTTSGKLMTSMPQGAESVSAIYRQSVYDPSENKIGEVSDLIVQNDGKIAAAMVGVGGFLGVGEKDVAVPFDEIHKTTKDNKTFLVMNTTKEALKNAPGFKYEHSTGNWVPDTTKQQ